MTLLTGSSERVAAPLQSPRSQNAIPNTREACARTGLLHIRSFRQSFAAHENISRNPTFICEFPARANAIAKASFHTRRYNGLKARRRGCAIARRQMGCFRLRRCRSPRKHEDFALVDRTGRWSGSCRTALKSNAESRGAPATFTRWKEVNLDLESDRSDTSLDVRFRFRERSTGRQTASSHIDLNRCRWRHLVIGRKEHR